MELKLFHGERSLARNILLFDIEKRIKDILAVILIKTVKKESIN